MSTRLTTLFVIPLLAYSQSLPDKPVTFPLPSTLHWCSQHCSTWTLDKGAPFDKPHYGNQALGSIVIVERFTRESVIMHRTDYRPYPGTAVLRGQLSPDGNSIVNGTIEWTYHPCCGLGTGKFQAAWGAAINTVPGSDAERQRMLASNSAPATPVPAAASEAPSNLPSITVDASILQQRARGPIDKNLFRTLSASDPPDVVKASATYAWKTAEEMEAQNKFRDALFWYERAAAKGNMKAASEIGFLYQFGLGVAKDNSMAARWYEAATARGDMVATRRLGVLLFRGLGVKQDLGLSNQLSEHSFDMGNIDAAFGLAMLYENGTTGVARQPALAQSWYQKGFAELHKAQSLCGANKVRGLMSDEIANILTGLYNTPTATLVFSVMAGTNPASRVPSADANDHPVTAVNPTTRHGDYEAECDVDFPIDPRTWSFKVNYFPDTGDYIVRAATGAQWFQLMALRPMMKMNGVRVPIGLQNLNEFETQTHR